jgi:hypothetical protein
LSFRSVRSAASASSFFGVAADNDDVRAEPREQKADGASDTACAARDDRDKILERVG